MQPTIWKRNFPEPLASKYQPSKIADFVGLEKPKKIFTRFLAGPYPSEWLFSGPSGTGKTSFALALANELGAEIIHIPSQECNAERVKEVTHMCHYVPLAGTNSFHLVLVDEADKMSPAAQLAFLSKLDATAKPPQTIFVFTCNGTEGLEPRFLSRTRQIEFTSYGMAGEASAFLSKVWGLEAGENVPSPNFAQIMRDSRNNLRDALMRVETELLAC